jgi:hypothetical protein
MSNLVFEIILRLGKAAAAAVLGAVVYLLLIGPFQVHGSTELVLLSWLSGAALVLLVESSPF